MKRIGIAGHRYCTQKPVSGTGVLGQYPNDFVATKVPGIWLGRPGPARP